MAHVFALIVTHPGFNDSFGNEQQENYQIQLYSSRILAENKAKQYRSFGRLSYRVEIRQIGVDNDSTIDL